MNNLRQVAQTIAALEQYVTASEARTALKAAMEQQQAEPVADEAIHAAWSAGYVEGEKAALEQPEQEPVAWGMPDALGNIVETISPDEKITDMKAWADQYSVPLYTAPPQQQVEPVGTARELFTNAALERLDIRPSTKVYLDAPSQRWSTQLNQMAGLAHGIKETL